MGAPAVGADVAGDRPCGGGLVEPDLRPVPQIGVAGAGLGRGRRHAGLLWRAGARGAARRFVRCCLENVLPGLPGRARDYCLRPAGLPGRAYGENDGRVGAERQQEGDRIRVSARSAERSAAYQRALLAVRATLRPGRTHRSARAATRGSDHLGKRMRSLEHGGAGQQQLGILPHRLRNAGDDRRQRGREPPCPTNASASACEMIPRLRSFVRKLAVRNRRGNGQRPGNTGAGVDCVPSQTHPICAVSLACHVSRSGHSSGTPVAGN